jgi:hypothetical protein
MLYTFVHSTLHADHDPTQSRGVTVGTGVGVGVGSGVGADVGACVGGDVHAPSPATHFRVTSPGCEQSAPVTRWILVQSASQSVYCSVHSGSGGHSPSPPLHTSSSPLANTHSAPAPCLVTEIAYTFVHCSSHSDHDPTQSIGITVGAGVGVGVGSGVGSTVLGLGVGCAVHAPSTAVHVNVTSLGLGQLSPLMRCIFTQSTPHSVNSSVQAPHPPSVHTSCSP